MKLGVARFLFAVGVALAVPGMLLAIAATHLEDRALLEHRR